MKHMPYFLRYFFVFIVISIACVQTSALSAEKTLRIGIYQNIPLTFIDVEGQCRGFLSI